MTIEGGQATRRSLPCVRSHSLLKKGCVAESVAFGRISRGANGIEYMDRAQFA
jgi:hypothetical protein